LRAAGCSGSDWETYLRFEEMTERRRDVGMAISIVSHFLAERERLDRVYSGADRCSPRAWPHGERRRVRQLLAAQRDRTPAPATVAIFVLRRHLRAQLVSRGLR
jgi:hypothetical protein